MKNNMKKCISKMLSLMLVLVFAAGCGITASSEESEAAVGTGTEEGSAENDTGISSVENYYLVTNVYGDGQKPWYLVIEYSSEVDPSTVSADDFEIEDYDIEAVWTNSEEVLPDDSAAGNYVLIEISTDYTTSNYGGSGSGGGGSDGDISMGDKETSEGSERPDSSDFNDTESGSGDIGVASDDVEFESGDMDFASDDMEFESGDTDFTFGDRESRSDDLDDSGFSERGDRSGKGSYDASENTGESFQSGDGSNSRGSMFSSLSALSNQLTVIFRQTGTISFSDGTALDAWAESCTTDYENNVNLLVENFSQYTFTLADGATMMYSLYLPENYNEAMEYPLVLFMPDATGEGSDEYLALTESLGGVIWTTEEWQSEHETIVLVPQYEDSNTEDPAYTMELVAEIVSQYSVDTSREYLVGQSSGTIRSIKLLIDYPDEFAGALLVAGQTDSAYTDSISDLSTQNIWMICSEGDARAYPGMTEITEAVEAEGTEVTIAQWSAALTDEEQEQLAAEQASAGTTINWTIFDTGTVMRDDVTSTDATEHMNTWRVAYDLDTVREWLFEQTK
ncbi:MAG: hypothetical protein LUG99_07495 [Lachnospiraceae bacterium]|nr:hypothetical protein [Lachnospiraceae bacterium]